MPDRPFPGSDQDPLRLVRKAHEARLLQAERRIHKVARDFFADQQRRTLARLNSVKARRGTRHWDYGASFNPAIEKKQIDPRRVFDPAREREAFSAAVGPEVDNVYAEFGEAAAQTLGVEFNLHDPNVTADLLARANRLAGAADTTWDQVRAAIIDGEMAGDSVEGIAKRIRRVFTDATARRSRMIARTEAVGAANAGSHEGARQSGVVGRKTWLAASDDRTRPTHVSADGQTVDLDKTFAIGASRMKHPGDPQGGPAETVNCRCTMLFKRTTPVDTDDEEEVAPLGRPLGDPPKPKGGRPSAYTADKVVTKGGKAVGAGGKVPRAVQRAKAAIDKVHGSPELTRRPGGIPVIQSAGERTLGKFSYKLDGNPVSISVSTGGREQAMAYVHEFGHYFDHGDFGRSGAFSSQAEADDLFQGVLEAIRKSRALETINDMGRNPATYRREVVLADGRKAVFRVDPMMLAYLRKPYELFARAYAQWIAVESGDEVLLAELDWMRSADGDGFYPRQWDDEDFEPVRSALRKLFRRAGHIA